MDYLGNQIKTYFIVLSGRTISKGLSLLALIVLLEHILMIDLPRSATATPGLFNIKIFIRKMDY